MPVQHQFSSVQAQQQQQQGFVSNAAPMTSGQGALDKQALEDALSRSPAFQSLAGRLSGVESHVSQQGEMLTAIRQRQDNDSMALSEILGHIRQEKAKAIETRGGGVHGRGDVDAEGQARGQASSAGPAAAVGGIPQQQQQQQFQQQQQQAAAAPPFLPVRMLNFAEMTGVTYQFHLKFVERAACQSHKEAKFQAWEEDDSSTIDQNVWLRQISRCKNKVLWKTKIANLGVAQNLVDAEEDTVAVVRLAATHLFTAIINDIENEA
eukprot:TRINITY_DN26293_c1_g1_i1.p1 TRINITY_DN26293_c1_g1~~TRINITY_DN26293_c1_g1_i1.p1  ORF type:complete len:265 (-),score=91.07 TRINITY_DN26293_c1_g1_i1:867-1661(-)